MGGLSPAFHKLSSTRSIWGQRLIELWSLSSWINLWLCETSGLTDGTAHYLRSICEVRVREGVCFFFLIGEKKLLVRDGEAVDGNVFTGLWVATVVVKITLTTHDFSASNRLYLHLLFGHLWGPVLSKEAKYFSALFPFWFSVRVFLSLSGGWNPFACSFLKQAEAKNKQICRQYSAFLCNTLPSPDSQLPMA